MSTLLSARGLKVAFAQRRRVLPGWSAPPIQVLRDVDLDIRHGEVLALVGESGSGKSTLARTLVRAIRPDAGQVLLEGRNITRLEGAALRSVRRQFQMVFQDPADSLNPRLSIGSSIAEPLHVHQLARGPAVAARVAECLRLVGLLPELASRRPHALSGGQRQRACIARAIAAEPRLIVADEAVAALDPSVRENVLELLQDLKSRCALTYLFISHDLDVVHRIADRVAVMYLGRLVEVAPTATLYASPAHPYTRLLLDAVPRADPPAERARAARIAPPASPDPASSSGGCAFAPRCTGARELCRKQVPGSVAIGADRHVACHFPLVEAALPD